MKIYPLTITQVDWKTYIQLAQDILGESPTRGLDIEGIDINNPAAFLSTLDLENQPLKNLREGHFTNNTFQHVSFSFIGKVDTRLIITLPSKLPLKIISKTVNDVDHLIILTGTMFDWYFAILIGCSTKVSKPCRILMNQCYMHFSNGGFKEIWSKYTKEQLPDKTFIFKG